ncbi:MAG: SufE family protein [Phycisphaerae bacterium]
MTASTTHIDDRQDQAIEQLNRRKDWFDKYDYLIDLGRSLPEPDDELTTDHHAMKGCQSKVWIRADLRGRTLELTAFSDSLITRGMIVLVLDVLEGATPEQVVEADLYFIEQTGLDRNLSPARANGLKTIVNHIQGLAREHL